MPENLTDRTAQIESVVMEIKPLANLSPEEMARLRQDLTGSKPGDILENEKYTITVDQNGFHVETK